MRSKSRTMFAALVAVLALGAVAVTPAFASGKPFVETKPATEVGEAEATLEGTVNPNGAETKYYFEYGETTSYGSKTEEVGVGSGETNKKEKKEIILTAGTTYHFRIVATNGDGTSYGADEAFTTTGTHKPTVETKPASSETETGATLNGSANPHGLETKYYFEYGETTSYGSKTAEASAGSGKTSVAESKAITGLKASTTYHFRIVATNSKGTSDGADRVFTSPPKPSVETKPATGIGRTSAGLNGVVDPRGKETKYYFEYGTTEAYGTKTAEASAGSGSSNVEEAKSISGLTEGTKYDFRIVAASSAGTTYGANEAFTTATLPEIKTPYSTFTGTFPSAKFGAYSENWSYTDGKTSEIDGKFATSKTLGEITMKFTGGQTAACNNGEGDTALTFANVKGTLGYINKEKHEVGVLFAPASGTVMADCSWNLEPGAWYAGDIIAQITPIDTSTTEFHLHFDVNGKDEQEPLYLEGEKETSERFPLRLVDGGHSNAEIAAEEVTIKLPQETEIVG